MQTALWASEVSEVVSILHFRSVCEGDEQEVWKSALVYFFLKVWVSVNECMCVYLHLHLCVGCLTERDSPSEWARHSVFIFLWKRWLSLRRIRLISCWLTVQPKHKGVSTWVTHTHTHMFDTLQAWHSRLSSCLVDGGRRENEKEIKEERHLQTQSSKRNEWKIPCVCVYESVCMCWLVLVPGYLHDNYLSSSVIRLAAERHDGNKRQATGTCKSTNSYGHTS